MLPHVEESSRLSPDTGPRDHRNIPQMCRRDHEGTSGRRMGPVWSLHSFHPNARNAEAGGLQGQSQPGLHSKSLTKKIQILEKDDWSPFCSTVTERPFPLGWEGEGGRRERDDGILKEPTAVK